MTGEEERFEAHERCFVCGGPTTSVSIVSRCGGCRNARMPGVISDERFDTLKPIPYRDLGMMYEPEDVIL